MTDDRRTAFHRIARKNGDRAFLTSAWQHHVGHEYGAAEFAGATVDFVKRWDWDWVKINPRAIYYGEIWDAVYDHEDYDWLVPKTIRPAIQSASDISRIDVRDPETNQVLREQADAARLIRTSLSDRAILDTIFSPLSVLLQLADLPLYPEGLGSDKNEKDDLTRQELIFDQPDASKEALGRIARTLADFAALLVTPREQGGAGLDGIFFAETGLASHDYFNQEQFEEWVKPYDRVVIQAVRSANPDAVVLLHTCREEAHPERFMDLNPDLLHWDQFLPGNPEIDVDFQAVPVGGANFELFNPGNDTSQIRKELDRTIEARQGHPFLLAPSCTISTPADEGALRVLSQTRAPIQD